MFFWLAIDKSDKYAGERFVRRDDFVTRKCFRAWRQIVLAAALALCLFSDLTLAAPPLFDTSVRVGTPFFARVSFVTPVSPMQGLIRLPSESEVTSVGGRWFKLHDSLELVPSVSKFGVYYINSKIPVDRETFTIYIAQEATDALDLHAFEVRLVGGATRVSVQTLRAADRESRSAQIPVISGSVARSELKETALPRKEPRPFETRDAKRITNSNDIELDDDLSEKLRELITAQAAAYQKPINNAVVAQVEVPDDRDSPMLISSGAQQNRTTDVIPAESNQIATATPPENPLQMTTKPALSVAVGNSSTNGSRQEAEPPNDIFDFSLSMTELLFIAIAGWLIYFSKLALELRRGLFDQHKGYREGLKSGSAVQSNAPEVNVRSQQQTESSTTGNSALANVLRSAAAQAELSERLISQSHFDARTAQFAHAQQQALFDCAQELQGITMAVDPWSPPSTGSSAPPQTNLTTPPGEAAQDDTAVRPNVTPSSKDTPFESTHKKALDARKVRTPGAKPHPADQRHMGQGRGVKPEIGKAPPDDVQGENANTPQVAGEDYSEQISLAAVYFNMGEVDTARSLLDTIIKDGSADEKAQAQKFIREKFDV